MGVACPLPTFGGSIRPWYLLANKLVLHMHDNQNSLFLLVPAGNTCPPLPTIDNGGVIYTDLLLSIGVIANFVCNDGYSLHGHGHFECSVDGVWIGSNAEEITVKPTCEGI